MKEKDFTMHFLCLYVQWNPSKPLFWLIWLCLNM